MAALPPYWFTSDAKIFSIDRLEDALRQRSFTVLDRYRAPVTAGGDTLAGAWLAAGQVVPRPWMPWLPRPTIVGRVARLAVCLAAVPLGLVAAGANRVRAAFGGDDQPGNAFRVLARYDGAPADPSGS